MLIDTDIIIDYTRGVSFAKQFMFSAHAKGRIYGSSVTELEVLQGALDKSELRKITHLLENFTFKIPTREIWIQAKQLIVNHSLSHGMRYSDALIAATALKYGFRFCSKNHKHFQFVKGLNLVPYRLPLAV